MLDESKSLIEAYVPAAYLWAAMVVFAGVLLSIGAVFAGGLIWALADSLAVIWAGAGALVVAIGIYVFLRLLNELQEHKRHRDKIETMQAEALLRERDTRRQGPQVPSLAISTGVEITMVGNIIDKRDLEYFCRQIAATHDWTARRWEGLTLPFGYRISNKDASGLGEPTSYARLLALFTGCKPPLILNRSDRKTGELTESDPDRMLNRIIGA